MKPIEGLDLATITIEAEQERIRELTATTRRKISVILGKHYEARGSIADLERQLGRARERLAKEQAKLDALQKGDWTALEEEKKNNEDQQQGQKSDWQEKKQQGPQQ